MVTLVRFSLHHANAQRYRAAYQVLSRLGFDPVLGDFSPGGAAFPGAAMAALPGDPAEHARAAFVALSEASLEPVGVAGVPLLDSARPRACA
jgi:hypothetical protein